MGGGGIINKVMKKVVGVEKIFGTNKLTGGIYDKYLGTDILGKKEAQEKQAAADRDANQRALNSQNNANVLDVNAQLDNVVQTDTGGSAAMSADAQDNDLKKRRAGSISSTLGI